ncbi:MAG TPA: ABC transporter permease [Chloroflexi bacterium]|nr:ABC transporter permease [Chloroflexota bacterium]
MSVIAYVRELAAYRELLWSWVGREVKVRYKQSLLGAAWAILQPLSATIIMALVFAYFVRLPTGGIPYPIFYYSALLPWTFTVTSITLGTESLVRNMHLVTKIYFPREILPLASVLAGLVDLSIASVVFVLMMLFYRFPLGPTFLLVPLLLLIQVLLTSGVVLFSSALNVFYRDVRFIVPLGVQLWMYLTPIIYPVDLVPDRFRAIYMLNPMAVLIDGYRRAILYQEWPDPTQLLVATAVSLLVFVLAYAYFKRAEAVFADVI